jgi:hypothetical protein
MIKTIEITNVSHFLAEVQKTQEEHEKALLFRGQPAGNTLLPRLFRGKLNEINITEKDLFNEFKRVCNMQLSFNPKTDLDYLSIAQHHGLSTRLLDWTYSALVALWFATKEENGIDGSVFIIKTKEEHFDNENILSDIFTNDTKQLRTLIVRPRHTSQRIVAQQGMFTLHAIFKHKTRGHQVLPINGHRHRMRKDIIEMKIENQFFKSIRKELNIAGINHYTLFPDLDGLCQYLNWRHIDRKTNN